MADSQVLPPPLRRQSAVLPPLRYSPRIARPPCEHCGDPEPTPCRLSCCSTRVHHTSCCGCTGEGLLAVVPSYIGSLVLHLGTSAHLLRCCEFSVLNKIIRDLEADTTTPEEVLARHGKPGCCWP
jgi:hypothetical protein